MTGPVTAAEPTVDADRRREIGAVLGLMVLAGGGALLACSRVWLTLAVNRPAPFAALSVTVPGRTEFPALAGLAVVTLLAGIVALIAGRWARTVLGVLVVLSSLAEGWYAWRGFAIPGDGRLRELMGGIGKTGTAAVSSHRSVAWPSLTFAFAALSLLAGLALAARGRGWKAGLSSRYAAPVEVALSADPWRSLDRGEDPTIADG